MQCCLLACDPRRRGLVNLGICGIFWGLPLIPFLLFKYFFQYFTSNSRNKSNTRDINYYDSDLFIFNPSSLWTLFIRGWRIKLNKRVLFCWLLLLYSWHSKWPLSLSLSLLCRFCREGKKKFLSRVVTCKLYMKQAKEKEKDGNEA